MEIYDLYGNDGLASGIYRCRAARGGLNFKICDVCFDMLFVLMRCAASEILSRICRRDIAMAAVCLRFTRSFGS
nr:hypothetical protein [uncultured Campylobacter sp.]